MFTNAATSSSKSATVMMCLHLFCVSFPRAEDITDVTRDYLGDIFTLNELICNKTTCDRDGRQAAEILGESCRCQCAPSYCTFREDRHECVKDVADCPMAMFVRPFRKERIPLIFLPSQGQFLYPGAHISISGIASFTSSKLFSCKVKTTEYMTAEGWKTIEKSRENEMFGITSSGNKTFLKWLGDDRDRVFLQHRLVLIRLICGTDSNAEMFEPCAGLRIGWARAMVQSPQPENKKNSFIIIGLCLGILGFTYVLAFLIYLKLRKKTPKLRENLSTNINPHIAPVDGETSSQLHPQVGISVSSQEIGNTNGISLKDDSENDVNLPTNFLSSLVNMIRRAKRRFTGMRRPKLLNLREDNLFEATYKPSEDVVENKILCTKVAENGDCKYRSRMEAVYSLPIDAVMDAPYVYPFQANPKLSEMSTRNNIHSSTSEECCNKFDIFRRDLYEKIRQVRDNENNLTEIKEQPPIASCKSQICKGRNRNTGYSPILEENANNSDFEIKFLSEELKEERMTDREAIRNGYINKNHQIPPKCTMNKRVPPREIPYSSNICYQNRRRNSRVTEQDINISCKESNAAFVNPCFSDFSCNKARPATEEKRSKSVTEAVSSQIDEESIDVDQYLQLSSQVAQKLSASVVPEFNCNSTDKQVNNFGHIWKDFRSTIERIKHRFDVKPTTSNKSLPTNDNWMLKKNESPTNRLGRLVRKISFTKSDTFKIFRSSKITESCESLSSKSAITSDDASKCEQTINSNTDSNINNSSGTYAPIEEIVTNESTNNNSALNTVIEVNIQESREEEEIINNTRCQTIDEVNIDIEETCNNLNFHREEDINTEEITTSEDSQAIEDINVNKEVTMVINSPKSERKSSLSETSISTSRDETSNSESSVANSDVTSIKSVNEITTDTTEIHSHQQSFDSDTLSMAYSDMTEDSLNIQGYFSNTDTVIDTRNQIDACVTQLSDTIVDSDGKIYRGGRATKGFDISQYFRAVGWEHICQEKKSQPSIDKETKLGSYKGNEYKNGQTELLKADDNRSNGIVGDQFSVSQTQNERSKSAVSDQSMSQAKHNHTKSATKSRTTENGLKKSSKIHREVIRKGSSSEEEYSSRNSCSERNSKIKRRRVSSRHKKQNISNGCKHHVNSRNINNRLEKCNNESKRVYSGTSRHGKKGKHFSSA